MAAQHTRAWDAMRRSADQAAVTPSSGSTASLAGKTVRASAASDTPNRSCSTPLNSARRSVAARDLHEGRDLRATTDLRALFKGVLHERFGVPEAALARTVFPASDAVEPLEGVTAA